MSCGVYIESTVFDLKPKLLEFLNTIVEKVREFSDPSISVKKTELAGLVGKDIRTVTRYLTELQGNNVIQVKGVRGRAGGTVISINTDLIKFKSSTKSTLVNDVDINEEVKKRFPKKEPKKPKTDRKRRTKQQMLEARVLQSEKQKKVDELNHILEMKYAGLPQKEWFDLTDDPEGNYKTYLISQIYSRYAILFTDAHNARVDVWRATKQEGDVDKEQLTYKVPKVSDSYNVLPTRFYGTPRWNQFDKLRIMLDENGISPGDYLSAQFNRTIYTAGFNGNKKFLPFVNSLTSDSAYQVFKESLGYHNAGTPYVNDVELGRTYFKNDFLIQGMVESYEEGFSNRGLLSFKHSLKDFFEGNYSDKASKLLTFYRITDKNMKNKGIDTKTRDLVKKYIMFQSLVQTEGVSSLPAYYILGSEQTRAMLLDLEREFEGKELEEYRSIAIASLLFPKDDLENRKKKGSKVEYSMSINDRWQLLADLMLKSRGLYTSIRDVRQALKKYGLDKIPVDQFSMLDTKEVSSFVDTLEEKEDVQEVDLRSITEGGSRLISPEPEVNNKLEVDLSDYIG